MKTCRKGHDFSEEDHRQCPECAKDWNRNRYKRDREKRIRASVEYFKIHKDKKSSNNKLYWDRHPDKVKQHQDRFKEKNFLYSTWTGMINRCYRESTPSYHDYGGRGIDVCPEWRGPGGYKRFVEDMGAKPTPKHTLERKNNDLGYSKDNCKWATRKEQGANQRSTVFVTICGRTQSKTQWVQELGISHSGFNNRIKRGWTEEKLLQKVDRKWHSQLGRERELEMAVIYLMGLLGDSVYERKFEIESLVGVKQEIPSTKPSIV